MIRGNRRGERKTVRPGGLAQWCRLWTTLRAVAGVSAVEALGPAGGLFLDAPADASFTERESHPRLELRDDARLHVRMRGQIVVESVGPRIHERLEPRGARSVLRLHAVRVDEQLHAEIAPDLRLTFGFRKPALRVDEVGLDAVEVVFGLRIHQPEDDVGVLLSVHVRNAPIVPDDGHSLRGGLQTSGVRIGGIGLRAGSNSPQHHRKKTRHYSRAPWHP